VATQPRKNSSNAAPKRATASMDRAPPTDLRFYAEEVELNRMTKLKKMQSFLAAVRNPAVLEGVVQDPALFTSIVGVAVNEYGVSQKALSDKTGMTIAAVGKWLLASEPSVPSKGYRPRIIQDIGDLLEKKIAALEERD